MEIVIIVMYIVVISHTLVRPLRMTLELADFE